jgi:hypothetical protein
MIDFVKVGLVSLVPRLLIMGSTPVLVLPLLLVPLPVVPVVKLVPVLPDYQLISR